MLVFNIFIQRKIQNFQTVMPLGWKKIERNLYVLMWTKAV